MADTRFIYSRVPAQPDIALRDGLPPAPVRDSGDLADLLNSGGDSRLRLSRVNNLNAFGCRPLPRPEALSFASSTASSISERAFAAVESAMGRWHIKDELSDLGPFVEEQRAALKSVWQLGADTDVIFAPSGTDAELRALFLARSVLRAPVVSIVVSSDETGSGVPFAAVGRHFDSATANGFEVVKGESIHGLGQDIRAQLIPTLRSDGCARPADEVDDAVFQAAQSAIAGGSSVILHVMTHSKLGTHAPTPECLRRITENWGDSVQVIIDACQARVSRARIKADLAQNRIVLITGSKFFTGPAFSGALLVPAALSARAAASHEAPLGFLKYTSASDWPAHFERLRSLLPPTVNLGQALRWTAALDEMRHYLAVPDDFRSLALAEFARFALQCLRDRPHLRQLEHVDASIEADEEFSVPTVFPFLPMRKGRPCPLNEAKLLYRGLNEDLSAHIQANTPRERRLLAQRCHIGQPVPIPQATGESAGALRVSADARLVAQSWLAGDPQGAATRFRSTIERLPDVFDKLQLLTDHLDDLRTLDFG